MTLLTLGFTGALDPLTLALLAGGVVVGGGAKCGSAWRYCGARGDPAQAAEEEEEEERGSRRPAKEKKKRMAKKEQIGSRQSRMA